MEKLPDSKLNIKLMAFDLDDTLLSDQKIITPKTLDALRNAAARGIYIVLCSGRPETGIFPIVEMLGLKETEQGKYVIGFNGAEVFDLHTGEMIYARALSPSTMSLVYNECKLRNLAPIVYANGNVYSNKDNKWTRIDADLCKMGFVQTDEFEKIIETPKPKMLVPADPADVQNFLPVLKEKLGDQVDVFVSKPFFLEVMPTGVGKGEAILWLAEHLGIDARQTMGFGDSMNDESMLRHCGYSVAMLNGLDYVKEISTFITRFDNNNDGIADFINSFVI